MPIEKGYLTIHRLMTDKSQPTSREKQCIVNRKNTVFLPQKNGNNFSGFPASLASIKFSLQTGSS